MLRFWACNKAITTKSHKSWLPNKAILWGHKSNGSCEGILVSQQDYEFFVHFVNMHPVAFTDTYEMKIKRVKGCIFDYWSLYDFQIQKGRLCTAYS